MVYYDPPCRRLQFKSLVGTGLKNTGQKGKAAVNLDETDKLLPNGPTL